MAVHGAGSELYSDIKAVYCRKDRYTMISLSFVNYIAVGISTPSISLLSSLSCLILIGTRFSPHVKNQEGE